MNIEMGKAYQTRDGRKVRLLCTDCVGPYPIVGLVDGITEPYTWTNEGQFDSALKQCGIDLVLAPTKITMYANLLPQLHGRNIKGYLYSTAEDARQCAGSGIEHRAVPFEITLPVTP